MKDKSLGIWIIILFGISGIAVIGLAWLWPTLESDRFITTIAGSIGIIVAGAQGLMLRQPHVTPGEQVAVEVEVTEKS